VINGVLSAAGTVSGNVLNGSGGVVGPITQALSVPVQVAGSCQILALTLRPLDLNLLGLTIHPNQVVLNITTVSGAGNLLGNLLCAVANLLNAGGPGPESADATFRFAQSKPGCIIGREALTKGFAATSE
jgi:hypothetical protein